MEVVPNCPRSVRLVQVHLVRRKGTGPKTVTFLSVASMNAKALAPCSVEVLFEKPCLKVVFTCHLIVSVCSSDIAVSFAKDDIEYLASRHVIYGVTENCDLAATGEDLTTLSLSESGRIRDSRQVMIES